MTNSAPRVGFQIPDSRLQEFGPDLESDDGARPRLDGKIDKIAADGSDQPHLHAVKRALSQPWLRFQAARVNPHECNGEKQEGQQLGRAGRGTGLYAQRGVFIAPGDSGGGVGNEYVKIEKGSTKSPECPAGCTLPSREAVSMGELMQQGQKLAQSMQGTIKRADTAVENFSNV